LRLGVFGGTFDPVHIGHLVLAEAAREQAKLDSVLFLPAGQPWRKPDREVTPMAHRLAMVSLAIAGNESFDVSTAELEREGPSYTAVTLTALRRDHPGSELFFITGADALADMPNWRDPQRIVDLATILVAARGGEAPAPAVEGARVQVVRMPEIGVSSSDLRQRVAAGASIRYLVPEPVRAYIAAHSLYAG
jgi:nicotinate-nucleotide adenylyltransferase